MTLYQELSIINKMRKLLLSLIITAGIISPVFSEGTVKTVSAIKVEGNKVISLEKIITQIKIRIGQLYNENVISDDIKRIYDLGYFEDISVDLKNKENNKVEVIFKVKEKPVLKKLTINGTKRVRKSKVLEVSGLKEGSFLEDVKLKTAQEAIVDLYYKKGFPQVVVDYKVSLDKKASEADVVFDIYENQRLKIKKIFVKGNIAFSDKRLIKLIKTRPAWLFRSGFFNEKTFADDLERIKDFYKQQGFSDAKVTAQKDIDKIRRRIFLTINVEEGRRYLIGKVEIEGYKKISLDKLRKGLTVKKGSIYSEGKVRSDSAKVQKIYFNEGYIFAQVKPVSYVNPDTGFVDITFQVEENNLVYVRMIDIRGNSKTKDKVIRRELRLKPLDRFSGAKLERSKDNLKNLGFFEEVNFDTEPTDKPDYEDLIVNVKEAKTGSLSFGGGYSSVDAFIGFIELRQKNFDLFNFPYFTGAGQDLSLYFQTGTASGEYMLSFTEPWLFDKPVSLGFDVYRRQHDNDSDAGYGYSETRTGERIRLGRRFSDFLKAGVSYNFETVKISDLESDASQALIDEVGQNDISKVGFSLTYDKRDNVFSPTKGFIFSNSLDVAGGVVGGDKDFVKLYSRFSTYFPCWRGAVLELKLRGGAVKAYSDSDSVPIYERFFAGGASTIRGYRERKVGPIDSANNPLGGEALFIANLEYTYPLSSYLKAAAFFDTGNVWSDYSDMFTGGFKSGIGLGIRVKTPIGPVSVDYGYPLNVEPGEDSRSGRFTFNVSRGF